MIDEFENYYHYGRSKRDIGAGGSRAGGHSAMDRWLAWYLRSPAFFNNFRGYVDSGIAQFEKMLAEVDE